MDNINKFHDIINIVPVIAGGLLLTTTASTAYNTTGTKLKMMNSY